MRAILLTLLAMIGTGLFGLWSLQNPNEGTTAPLVVYCAAGVKRPVEKIARQFRSEFGQPINLQYGGTGTLVFQIGVAKHGDLFIAADTQAIEIVQKQGRVQKVVPLAKQYPVVCVPVGNPKNILTLDDLFRVDVKIGIGNPETASIGKSTRNALGKRWGEFQKRAAVTKFTVTEIAMDVTVGSIDAAIVWNSTVPQFDKLESVPIPEFKKHVDTVSIAVLKSPTRTDTALRFAQYLSAPNKGSKVLADQGFQVIPGDVWLAQPNRLLEFGNDSRPASEDQTPEDATP